MPKDEAKECIALLRRMEKEFPMGKRYRMRKLPNKELTGAGASGAVSVETKKEEAK